MSFVKAEAAVASTPATPQVNTLSSSSPALQLRQSNVKDALDYLNTVKSQFREQPVVYSDFLTMMQDFKQQRIDTPSVMKRVSILFKHHPELIQGFNGFLPDGYCIDESEGAVTVSTPTEVMVLNTASGEGDDAMSWSITGRADVATTEVSA